MPEAITIDAPTTADIRCGLILAYDYKWRAMQTFAQDKL